MAAEVIFPVKVKGEHRAGHPFQFDAYLVPETDGVFAVDQRYPLDWYITHMPTMMRVVREPYTNAPSRDRIIDIAQQLYRLGLTVGINWKSKDPATVVEHINHRMDHAQREAFWKRVARIV